MNANNLRLGNLAQDQNGNLLIVIDLRNHPADDNSGSIGFTVVDRSKFPLPDGWRAEPIPLTDEWLEKFGFVCVDTHDDHHYYKASTDFMLDRGYQFDNYHKRIKLQHVHQLQNLYFALTGEELNFVN